MKKKRSTVWRHFKEESDNKVSCRTCHKILTNHGNTSIMLRHLRGKHPELVGCLLELDGPTVTGEVTWPVDNQPQQVDEAEAVVDNTTTGGNKKRSTVWRHFQEEGNDKVSCRICREKLAKHGNTSSMLRHLRGKHPQLKLPLFQGERKSSRFHLKTNMTESRFMAICDRLLRNNQLTDCTLVAEGQFVQAHRLVLASCSESFEEIFRNVTQVNPVIVLRDVSIQELRGLINYMYKGETLVKSNELHGLLKAAAQLKIKGLSQVGLSDTWLEPSSSQSNGSGRLHPKEDLSYYHHDDNDLEDMEDEMEHHIVQPATSFNKRHATLDLMSMCEDVDLGGGPATKDGTHAEDRLLKRVQIKVEHGTALVDSEPQPDNHLPQQQEPHTATHYISAGEEVVIHQNSHEIQHTHRGDETIEATVTMAHDPLSTSSDLEAPSITSAPILEDGSQQQPTTSHTTIDEDGLILLGLSGGETHTTIISAGTSTPLHTSETQRPTIARRPRKYTKRDLMTALKLVDEGHLALKPAARAFNIPVTTLYTASKRRDATGSAMKEENK